MPNYTDKHKKPFYKDPETLLKKVVRLKRLIEVLDWFGMLEKLQEFTDTFGLW